MTSNDKAGIVIKQPRERDERLDVAKQCCTALEISMPLVVDEMDDRVGRAYSGMPDRLYVIDRAGRVAYKGGRGPFGFKPGEMEQALVMTLLDQESAETGLKATPQSSRPAAAKSRLTARVPLLDDHAAWAKLPKLEGGKPSGRLPTWARALAGSLPRTTAAMLELDYLHREKSPLDPALRAKVRWTAAKANRSPYAEAVALADLRRAGLGDDAIKAFIDGKHDVNERAVLDFARKLSEAAYTVTDEEVAHLLDLLGPERTVALVQLLAYANFQDRLLLALDLPVDEEGLTPFRVRFVKRKPDDPPPTPVPRMLPDPPADERLGDRLGERGTRFDDPEWLALDFDQLQKQMQRQRARQPRIPVPAWEEVQKKLPPGAPPRKRPMQIRWSLVCMGYQPELAAGWSACTRAFAEEAKQSRVFEELLFWVATRSLHCFY